MRLLRHTVLMILLTAFTQDTPAQPRYQLPVDDIKVLADAPATPAITIAPNKEQFLILERNAYLSIADLAAPELRLAGIRINPKRHSKSRLNYFTAIKLRSLSSKTTTSEDSKDLIGLPENAKISGLQWAINSSYIAFTLLLDERVELWVGEMATRRVKRLIDLPLCDIYPGSAYQWCSDSKHLLVRVVAPYNASPPQETLTPVGPLIQENIGKISAAPTYQDLLKSPHDEALFDHYGQSELLTVSCENGTIRPLGIKGMITGFEASPDGRYILVQRLERPFSYLVPYSRFPQRFEIYSAAGEFIKEVYRQPLLEEVPTGRDATIPGRRNISWREDHPATLEWVEAEDGGDPKKTLPERDAIYIWEAPFKTSPTLLFKTALRFGGIMWGTPETALYREFWWQTRALRLWRFNPSSPNAPHDLIQERSMEDRYADLGSPLMKDTPYGTSVLHMVGKHGVYMVSSGATPEGDRPYLSIFDLKTKESTIRFRSEPPFVESPVSLLKDEKTVLTQRESQNDSPNFFLRSLSSGKLKQITFFPNPLLVLQGISKEIIRYKRADGVDLSATLYLPAGYKKEDGPLPVLMWAYPQEFKDAKNAGQMSGSPYRFTRVPWSSPLFWLRRGFAILDDPKMPIIGEGNAEPNDTYIEQLTSSAKAAIDALTALGVGDPNRIAIGGHSYGAFMTANLLAHTDYFAAGIARSGAYNRTLTPFGFQSEERYLWQAPQTYINMSPFMYADKIKEPLLLIHGEADNNQGTFPLQSERFYHALKGFGATVRYVSLPHESHGYAARESILHMLWEMDEWLMKYVKTGKGKVSSENSR